MRTFLLLFFIGCFSLSSKPVIFLKNKVVVYKQKIKISDISYYFFGLEDRELFSVQKPILITKQILEEKIDDAIIIGKKTLILPLYKNLKYEKIESKALENFPISINLENNIKLRLINQNPIFTSNDLKLSLEYVCKNSNNELFFKVHYLFENKKVHSNFYRFEILRKQIIAVSNSRIDRGTLFNNKFVHLKEIFSDNHQVESPYFLKQFSYIARKNIGNGKILKSHDILKKNYADNIPKDTDSLLFNNFYLYYSWIATQTYNSNLEKTL